MLANNVQSTDVQKIMVWLDGQNHSKAECAKKIIQSKSIEKISSALCDVCDWLAVHAATVKEAGQAYCLVVDIANNNTTKEVL